MERTRSLVPQGLVSLPLQALSTKVNIRSEAPRPAERRVRDGWSARRLPRDQRLFHFFFKIQWPPRTTTMMKLARKLGIKPGMKVLIRDAPSDSLHFARACPMGA